MNSKLGRAAYLTIGTTDMDKSMELYNKLGYKVENEGVKPVRWTEICDGSLHIILVEGKDEYLGLTYVTDDMNSSIEQLKTAGLKPVMTIGTEEEPKQIIAQLRQGMLLSINQASPELDYKYVSKTLMDIDYMRPNADDFPNDLCGIFGELAINTSDMDEEISFWENIGFRVGERNEAPYPWAIVSDGLFIIGLHETEEFDKPALTYFAPDMADRLKTLEESGVAYKELDGGNSGAIETPEGQQFFLFPLNS